MIDRVRRFFGKIGWGVPTGHDPKHLDNLRDQSLQAIDNHEREQDVLIALALREAQAATAQARRRGGGE